MNPDSTPSRPLSADQNPGDSLEVLLELLQSAASAVTLDKWTEQARTVCHGLLATVDQQFCGGDSEATSLRCAVRGVLEWSLSGEPAPDELHRTIGRLARLYQQWEDTARMVH